MQGPRRKGATDAWNSWDIKFYVMAPVIFYEIGKKKMSDTQKSLTFKTLLIGTHGLELPTSTLYIVWR